MRNENKITVQTGIYLFQLVESTESFELGCYFVQKWYELDKTIELHDNCNDVLYMVISYRTKMNYYTTSLDEIQRIKRVHKIEGSISWRPINIR